MVSVIGMDYFEVAAKLAIYFVPFLFSLCFHEYAHGWVAKLRGDNTAQMMGRLTMNPIAHMDMVGTLMLPVLAILFNSPIFFGWAKPVPVNSRNLKNPRTDMFWVALAGPMSNILLAIVAAVVLALAASQLRTTEYFTTIVSLLRLFVGMNLFLAFFNLIPLNPLDGGKVIARFLPASVNYKLEQNEQMTSIILMILILFGGLSFLAYPVQWISDFLIGAALGVLG